MHPIMSRLILLILTTATGGPLVAAEPVDTYVGLVTGSFSSAEQAAVDDRYETATWQMSEIWPERDDGRWLYSENWIGGAESPYRQRILQATQDPSGGIRVRAYRLPDSERFVGAWKDTSAFDELDRSAITVVAGCDIVLARTGKKRFTGGTVGQRCANSHRGAAYAVSTSRVSEEVLVNWDRGFAADGTQVWGTEAGGYRFRPMHDGEVAEACNEPVRMVVFGTIEDRQAFGAYARAIEESGLYPKVKGYYEAITPALEVFEGDPPDERAVVIVRFPCLEAAREFWYSETYQNDILPIRQNISDFEVLLLPALPVPDYIR